MRSRLSLVALAVTMILISGCKDKNETTQTEEEKQIAKLTGTWVLQTGSNAVTVAGNDVSADWASFALTLGDGTYVSASPDSPEVWPLPPDRTWAFGASNLNLLVRDDGIEITVSVTDTSLKLQFDYSASGGRFAGIEGNWVFNMVPQ